MFFLNFKNIDVRAIHQILSLHCMNNDFILSLTTSTPEKVVYSITSV